MKNSDPGPFGPRARKRRGTGAAALLSSIALCSVATAAVAQSPVPGGLAASRFAANAAATPDSGQVLHLVFGLKNVDRTGRDAYLKSLYDPKSPSFRQWLTPEEFGHRFGAPDSDVQEVANYATSHGMRVTHVWPNNSFISVDTTVQQAEAAFGVRIGGFNRPAQLVALGEPETFYGPQASPRVDASMASRISFIGGLSNLAQAHAHSARAANPIAFHIDALDPGLGQSPGTAFTGPVTPAQIGQIYHFNFLPSLGMADGSNKLIAIFSPTKRYASDVTTFASHFGISGYTIYDSLIDGGPTDFNGSGEAALDAEVILGQAPHTTIDYFECPNNLASNIDAFNEIATARPQVVSSSWSVGEDTLNTYGLGWYASAFDDIAAQIAMEGITFFNDSGDWGAYDPNTSNVSVQSEAASPYVTGVGGTSLPETNFGDWVAENPWSYSGGLGSGGGLSILRSQPWWQSGPGVDNASSNGMRQVPDVAALAGSPFYYIYANGAWGGWYGTSASTPLWAAATLLMDQIGSQHNQMFDYRVGYLNPSLYNLSANLPFAFHDILGGSDGVYSGGPGWDYITGIGSADFYKLCSDLVMQCDIETESIAEVGNGTIWNLPIHLQVTGAADDNEPASFNDTTSYTIGTASYNAGPADAPVYGSTLYIDKVPVTFMTPAKATYNQFLAYPVSNFKFSPGAHTISVVFDSDHAAPDSNYGNNVFTRTIMVSHVLQPHITSILPNPVHYGSKNVAFTVTGTDFDASDLVDVNGMPNIPTSATSTQLVTLAQPDALFTTSSPVTVTVDTGAYKSPSYSVIVDQCPTTLALATTPAAPVSGKPFTFMATVTDQSGTITPTGAVTFKKGATIIGTGTLMPSGTGKAVATVACSGLNAGANTITVAYSGDSTFAVNSAASAVNVLAALPSTTTVSFTPSSAVATQAVSFTVNVAGSGAAPTGTVTLFAAGVSHTLTLSGGVAYFIAPLPVGTDSVYAKYSGDANYQVSASATSTITVSKMSTATTVVSSNAAAPLGTAVTLTASVKPVAPAAGPVTGSVQYLDGATSLGTVALDSSGNAKLTKSNFTLGSHTITVNFLGSASATASSGAVTQTINKATPPVALAVTSATVLQGKSDTFKATITGVAGTVPTGNVTFKDGATVLGTAALNGGAASYNTAALSAGTHSITAVYAGDANYNIATSAAATVTVKSNASTTKLTLTPVSTVYGAPVKLTATITPASAGYTAPAGVVTFKDGATTLGVATISGTTAIYTTSILAPGSHSLTAIYGGDANWTGSTSAAATETVAKAKPTVAIGVSASTIKAGQTETLTATVTGIAGITPTGNVTFYDGATALGTAALSNGKATLNTSTLAVGSHSIKATYAGDTNYTSLSSANAAVSVTP